jgi:hypothetical protein
MARWFRRTAPLVARVEIALLAPCIATFGAIRFVLALGRKMWQGELAAWSLRAAAGKFR